MILGSLIILYHSSSHPSLQGTTQPLLTQLLDIPGMEIEDCRNIVELLGNK